ncbi:MAG: ATP-binding protein, partial [Methanomassiliicoccales archaeon]|nr:ATP-binding protein [Methanomassiliicoccales archaeon]
MKIEEVAEEWTSYALRKTLVQRELPADAVIRASKTKVVVISGVRRCGKSSFLMLLAQRLHAEGRKVIYVNLEDPRFTGEPDIMDRLLGWFGEEGYLLLDEVTAIPGWDGWLLRVHELLKGRLRPIVSSSKRSVRSPSRPLRGRCVYFDLFPLSFSERLSFLEVPFGANVVQRAAVERQVQEHLQYGGFPEVVLQDEPSERLRTLLSYHREIVGLDIAGETGMDRSLVELFSKYLLRSPYFSATTCTNFLKGLGYKVGKDKVLEMERAAADCMLFHFLNVHSSSIKDMAQQPRKVYAGDMGLHLIGGTEDLGRKLENLVCLELLRRLAPEEELFYWKDTAGAEVDFLVISGLKVSSAIQVCYDPGEPRTLSRELRGLERCSEGMGPERCLMITMDTSARYEMDGLTVD